MVIIPTCVSKRRVPPKIAISELPIVRPVPTPIARVAATRLIKVPPQTFPNLITPKPLFYVVPTISMTSVTKIVQSPKYQKSAGNTN